jgi:methionyl-tRNA formyltransferase
MSAMSETPAPARVVCLVNNALGARVLAWLRATGEDVVGLVLHAPERRTCGALLERAAQGLAPERVALGPDLTGERTLARIRDWGADIAVSVLFDHILRPPFLGLFPRGVVNLHPSYLPYNRGQYPNVWAIVEGTPAGATLHHIDAGVDTGDLIAQEQVPVASTDTGESLYAKLEEAAFRVFTGAWPQVRSGAAPRIPQPTGGTAHRRADVERIDRVDLDRTYTGRELIDLLRARTFPPYGGAYFEEDGRRVHLRLYLAEEDEVGFDKPGPTGLIRSRQA